jgi:hypothetical protein
MPQRHFYTAGFAVYITLSVGSIVSNVVSYLNAYTPKLT